MSLQRLFNHEFENQRRFFFDPLKKVIYQLLDVSRIFSFSIKILFVKKIVMLLNKFWHLEWISIKKFSQNIQTHQKTIFRFHLSLFWKTTKLKKNIKVSKCLAKYWCWDDSFSHENESISNTCFSWKEREMRKKSSEFIIKVFVKYCHESWVLLNLMMGRSVKRHSPINFSICIQLFINFDLFQ